MTYSQAVEKVKQYEHLNKQEIIEKATGALHDVHLVTIIPSRTEKVSYNYDLPFSAEAQEYFKDKECTFVIVINFNKSGHYRSFLTEQIFNSNYELRSK